MEALTERMPQGQGYLDRSEWDASWQVEKTWLRSVGNALRQISMLRRVEGAQIDVLLTTSLQPLFRLPTERFLWNVLVNIEEPVIDLMHNGADVDVHLFDDSATNHLRGPISLTRMFIKAKEVCFQGIEMDPEAVQA